MIKVCIINSDTDFLFHPKQEQKEYSCMHVSFNFTIESTGSKLHTVVEWNTYHCPLSFTTCSCVGSKGTDALTASKVLVGAYEILISLS